MNYCTTQGCCTNFWGRGKVYFMKQQNQLIKQEKTEKTTNETTTLQTQLDEIKSEIDVLKTQPVQTTTPQGIILNESIIIAFTFILIVAITLTAVITKKISKK